MNENFESLGSVFIDFLGRLWESLPTIAVALLVSIILYVVLGWAHKKLMTFVTSRADDKLLMSFINNISSILKKVVVFLIFLYILGFGGVAGSILGAAGLSAFVIGFALKDIGENFLAGVVMAFDRPFRLGDTIQSGDVEGVIKRMTLRETHVKTFDGKDVFIPNGMIIKNPLFNYTIDGFLRLDFVIGVDYATKVDDAILLIKDVLGNIEGILGGEKGPSCQISNLNTSTIDIKCFFWVDTYDKDLVGATIKTTAQKKVIEALTKADIGMPADIVELKNYDSALNTKSEETTENIN